QIDCIRDKISNGTLPMVSNENLLIMLQTAILL
ncbi:unnamed protein product, partial [Rotaria magnacalcarata]